MPINDDAMVKVMSSLGLNFNPAEQSIKSFEARIASLNKQLFEMKALALQGAKEINAAFSGQLGQLGGSKVILDQFGQPLKTVQSEAKKAAVTVGDMSAAYIKSSRAAKQHADSVQDVAKKYNILGNEFQRRTSWFLTGTLFYGTINAAKEAVQTISEVEMGVTKIARVTEDVNFNFNNMRDTLLDMGVEYGMTFDKVQDIALRWAQAGYNVKDTIDLTRASLLALNTAELNNEQATSGLIAVMAQWNIQANQLLPVIDKINKVADDFAVTSQDLVDGLVRSSGAAKVMGLSLEQTIALLTTMREASGRTGREVGNALNSILSYIQRPKSINVIEAMGINMFADQARTQFRNVMEIFSDISARWQDTSEQIKQGFVEAADDAGLFNEELATALGLQEEWNDLQQRDISQAAAGVYRRNYLIALMQRFSDTQKVLISMQNAEGYSIRENIRTMDTLEKKYAALIAGAERLAVSIGEAGLLDALKGLVDTGANVVEIFDSMDESLKNLIINFGLILGSVQAISAVAGMLGLGNLGAQIKAASAVAKEGGTLVATLSKIPGLWKLVAVATAAAGVSIYNDIKKQNAELEKQIAVVGALGESYFRTKDKLASLQENTVAYNQAQEELHRLMEDIVRAQPLLVTAFDEHAKVVSIDEKALSDIIKKYGELSYAQKALVGSMTTMTEEQKRLDKERLESTIKTIEGEIQALQHHIDYLQHRAPAYISEKRIATTWWQAFINSFVQAFGGEGLGELPEEVRSKELKELLDKLDEIRKEYVTKYGVDKTITEQESLKQMGKASYGGSNSVLEYQLKILQHKKRMNQLSIEDEVKTLKELKNLYAKNEKEILDMEERIYAAEKEYRDKRFDLSRNWINEMRELDQLTVQEEIAAWDRVLRNQADNFDAAKEARLAIYRLEKEEYKRLLDEEQNELEKAYKERIDLIDAEKDAKIEAQRAIIDEIEAEKESNRRIKTEQEFNKKIAELQKELQYHSVRTGEEHRKAIEEINQKIAEETTEWEQTKNDWVLDDRKEAAQKEIDSIEEEAKKQKAEYEKAFKLIKGAFDSHNLDVIAGIAATSAQAFNQWKINYIDPLRRALASGNLEDFQAASDSMQRSTRNAEIYQAASAIVGLKQRWHQGDTSAAGEASKYYEKLPPGIADAFRNMNYEQAKQYLATLPKFHTGAKTLSYGIAEFKPGELIFPPLLSSKIERLISVLEGRSESSLGSGRQINLHAPLLNVEKMDMGDEIDGEILSRQLGRVILSLK